MFTAARMRMSHSLTLVSELPDTSTLGFVEASVFKVVHWVRWPLILAYCLLVLVSHKIMVPPCVPTRPKFEFRLRAVTGVAIAPDVDSGY